MNEKEFVHSLYRRIYGTAKTADILAQFTSAINKVRYPADAYRLRLHHEPFISFGRSVATIKNIINDFKRVIKSADISERKKEWLLEAFSLPTGYYYAINEAVEKSVEERKEAGEKADFSIQEVKKILSDLYKKGMDKELSFYKKRLGSRQTPELIRSYYLAAYLALATGRRLTEILKTMELRKYRNSLKVSGILKKKEKDEKFPLYTIDDPNKVYKAYKELRRIFDCTNLTERECSKKYSAIFNRFIRDYMKKDISFHDLRALYAEVAYAENKDTIEKEGIEKSDFIEAILLHEKTTRPVDYYLRRIKIEK